MRKTASGGLYRGVVECYALSCLHQNIHIGDFPAIRHLKRADTVIMDCHALGGNAVLLFSVVHVDMVNKLGHHTLCDFLCVDVASDGFEKQV